MIASRLSLSPLALSYHTRTAISSNALKRQSFTIRSNTSFTNFTKLPFAMSNRAINTASTSSKTTSTAPSKSVCVFCGSANGNDPAFVEAGTNLGKALVENNYRLVYGGGNMGIMGAVSKAVEDNNGFVHGIIPRALCERERREGDQDQIEQKPNIKTTVVTDMHTRKRLMGQEADAFITLPGGFGTLEELSEVTTWSQLGIHGKPIIIYNVNGFYDGLKAFFDHCVQKGFVAEKHKDIVVFADTLEEVIDQVENYKLTESRYNLNWDNQ